jgi:hypothetical protein
VPVAPEVNAFQRKVGRDQNFETSGFVSRQQAQHGAVVSYPRKDGISCGADTSVRPPLFATPRHAANLGNQRFFGKRHDDTNI